MEYEQYSKKGETYIRINKIRARNLYKKGVTIYLLADNMAFDSKFAINYPVSIEDNGDFNAAVESFAHDNCDIEHGLRVKYFVNQKHN